MNTNGVTRANRDGDSYLSVEGCGTPLVLLHGIGSNADSFRPLIAALDRAQPVIAWDAPGYGHAEPLADDWPTASHYAARLLRLLDRTRPGPIDLVGHSLGALMAARFALEHPQRVRLLILISPALGYCGARGGELAASVAARLEDFHALGAEGLARARASRLVHRASERTDIVTAVAAAMGQVRLPGYLHASRMLATGDLLADAARLAVPTSVVSGHEDKITPPDNAVKLFAALSDASRGEARGPTWIADAGHAVCHEWPQEVARVIAKAAENASAAPTQRSKGVQR